MEAKDSINKIIEEKNQESARKSQETAFVKELLLIDINSYSFALQLEYLREVIDIADKNTITPIPFTPSYILGIINIRGEIVPVISLLEILGIKEKEKNCLKLAVIDVHFQMAFPFNDIIDLKSVGVNKIKELKDATKKEEDKFITQEIDFDNKKIGVIDILKVYSSHFFR